MNGKELIRELYKCNLEDDVLIISSESGSFNIVNVFVEDGIIYIEGK